MQGRASRRRREASRWLGTRRLDAVFASDGVSCLQSPPHAPRAGVALWVREMLVYVPSKATSTAVRQTSPRYR
jgi:hypothetical protein